MKSHAGFSLYLPPPVNDDIDTTSIGTYLDYCPVKLLPFVSEFLNAFDQFIIEITRACCCHFPHSTFLVNVESCVLRKERERVHSELHSGWFVSVSPVGPSR